MRAGTALTGPPWVNGDRRCRWVQVTYGSAVGVPCERFAAGPDNVARGLTQTLSGSSPGTQPLLPRQAGEVLCRLNDSPRSENDCYRHKLGSFSHQVDQAVDKHPDRLQADRQSHRLA
jgi:hypothetical protein